jgi:hypothetical protein
MTEPDVLPKVFRLIGADARLRRNFGQSIDRHLAEIGRFESVGLLAVGGGLAVEQAHGAVDPRPGADAGEQCLFRQRANEIVQPPL